MNKLFQPLTEFKGVKSRLSIILKKKILQMIKLFECKNSFYKT